MGAFFPVLWMVSGGTLCVGFFCISVYSHKQHNPYLSFGVLASLVATDLTLLGIYYSSSTLPVLRGIFEARFLLSCAIFPAAVWFIGVYTRLTHLRLWMIFWSAVYLVVLAAYASSASSLFFQEARMMAPFTMAGSHFYYINVKTGPLWPYYQVILLGIFLWILWRCLVMWQAKLHYKVWPILLYYIVELLALIYDGVNSEHMTSTIMLSQFAFLALVIIMGATLLMESGRKEEMFYKTIKELKEETTKRKQSEYQIEHYVNYDPLTKLPNRRMLQGILRDALERFEKTSELGAVVLLNLDHFQTINDSLGHDVGDKLLRQIAQKLQLVLKSPNRLCYLGGDEYAAVITGLGRDRIQANTQALVWANALRDALVGEYTVLDQKLTVGASMGVAIFPAEDAQEPVSVTALMSQADLALHNAKTSGRNRASLFVAEMQRDSRARLVIEDGLRQAIERNELDLYFQPQTDGNERLIGAEVLLRWRHPKAGLIEPQRFIPVAEDAGLIQAIGEYTLTRACQYLRAWSDQHIPKPPRLSVNVSPWELAALDYAKKVQHLLALNGILPGTLTLEITESAVLQNIATVASNIQMLTALGVRFSIDDFGSGYAGLSTLKKLTVHELKIDRAFVSDMTLDLPDRYIGSMLAMAHQKRLTVVAEGVETRAQFAALKLMHCDGFQGYLISKPLAELDFVQFMKDAELSTLLAEAGYPVPA